MDRSPRPARRTVVLGAGLTSMALLAACGGGSLGGGDDDEAGEDGATSITVGLSYPQSGVYAPLGEDINQGFQLYLDQNDGQLGGLDVELVTADEGEGPQTGVPATERLVTQDGADVVVGIVSSAVALGLQDAFIQAEVPLILANAGANDITAEGSDYIWRSSYRNGDVSGAIGEHVVEAVGDGSVYLIAADYAAGQEHVAGFREAFEAAGGTVAGETYTPFGTTSDFQPYLSEIQASDASAVFAFYAGAEAASFVQQYDQFGLSEDIQLYGNGFIVEGDLLEAQGESALGIQTSLPYSAMIDTERNTEFVEAYEEAYGEYPTIYAVSAYDAAAAVDAAAEAAESIDGPGIAAALGEIGEIDSPRGPWSFDENHDPLTPYYIREVQEVDGELRNVIIAELEG
ncbi:ABC transporter substrate-binding protein [Georgenia sp. Z1491]|uniref:ABC transporter substrate-binding protein n=1 Tax=Georgenia sp. Z1491 TaxID=3416707 RepID=UPI003CF89A7F